MLLAQLCLGLTLLGALQTQAKNSARSVISAPSLDRIRLQLDFQDDQFQGKWYVLGVAGNYIWKEAHGDFKMHSTTYKLEADHSYNVTTNLLSDKGCEHWNATFVPSSLPGRFILSKILNFPNMWNYMAQVVGTDYKGIALMYFTKTSGNTEYFRITLLRRTKQLRHGEKDRFICLAKTLGLTDDNVIFPDPVDRCIDD